MIIYSNVSFEEMINKLSGIQLSNVQKFSMELKSARVALLLYSL